MMPIYALFYMPMLHPPSRAVGHIDHYPLHARYHRKRRRHFVLLVQLIAGIGRGHGESVVVGLLRRRTEK